MFYEEEKAFTVGDGNYVIINSDIEMSIVRDNALVHNSKLTYCDVIDRVRIFHSEVSNVCLYSQMSLKGVKVNRQSQLYFNYVRGRSGIYPCTLVWQEYGVHFIWGCREGCNILKYVRGKYPNETVEFFEAVVKMMEIANNA